MKLLNAVKRWATKAVEQVKNMAQKAMGAMSKPAGVATTFALVAGSARAEGTSTFTLDVSSVIATINSAVTVVSSIGLAILSLVVVIKMFSWAKRALGG